MKKLALGVVSSFLILAAHAAPNQRVVTFDVMEFVIDGNTVLPANVVERVLHPYLGPAKTFKDIEAAREALERAFQDAGFLSVVVSLPNQRVDSGEVKLSVVQAQVDKLTVSGAQYHRPSKVKEQVPSLAAGQVPYFPQVQQDLAAVQSANMQVTPLISGGTEPDKIVVDLKAQDSLPLSGSIELNNRQSFNTTRGRLSASLQYGNLWQLGHRIGLSWQYAPWRPGDANNLVLSYGLPLSKTDDLTFTLTTSDSDTPIKSGDGGSTVTRGEFIGMRWQHELAPLNWALRHNLFVSVDYKHNQDKTEIVDALESFKPALRYTTVSTGYFLNWMVDAEQSLTWTTSINTSNKALSGRLVNCDGRVLDQFACKRSASGPDFLVWRTGLDWRRPVWGQWRVNASLDVQAASGALASGEQFSLGGADTVRGYYDYEQSGDWGANSRVELVSPIWLDWANAKATSLVFIDRGFVKLQDALVGQTASAQLGSAGLGLRVDAAKGLQLSVDAARTFFETSRPVDSGAYAPATKRQWRAHVSVKQAF